MLNQNVLGFQISVNNGHGVEFVESTDDFSEVEADDGRRKDMVRLAVPEDIEVAAGAIRSSPGKIIIGLERTKKVGEERMGRLLLVLYEAVEDGDFPAGTSVSVGLDGEGGLFDDFEGKRAAGSGIIGFVMDEKDCSHGTFA